MPAKRGTRTVAERPSNVSAGSERNSGYTANVTRERVLPANLDAEEGLLACCIMDGGQEILALCLEAKIQPDYFLKPAHQQIFEALMELCDEGSVVDEIILTDKLQRKGQLEEIGGYGAITHLTNRIETTAHARFWLEIVREKCLLRRLIKTSTEIVDRCYHSEDGLDELLEEAEQDVFKISQDRVSDTAMPIRRSMESAVSLVQNLLQRKGELTGVATGFIDLDRMTFGLHAQEMIVLASRPSLGKTSLAMNIAETSILPPGGSRDPVPTLVFSLEMSAVQLAFRLLCSRARVNMSKIKEGFAPKGSEKALFETAKELKDAPLWIDDSAHLTILEMRSKARRMALRENLGLIIIDYLQLLSGTDSRVSREQQISEMARGVKAMAKELNVPILVLSQLNRDSEREKRKPRLSDLRESGSIEQDADVVMLLSLWRSDDQEGEDASGTAKQLKLVIAKQRNGPIGDIRLTFIPELTRFENFTSQTF